MGDGDCVDKNYSYMGEAMSHATIQVVKKANFSVIQPYDVSMFSQSMVLLTHGFQGLFSYSSSQNDLEIYVKQFCEVRNISLQGAAHNK